MAAPLRCDSQADVDLHSKDAPLEPLLMRTQPPASPCLCLPMPHLPATQLVLCGDFFQLPPITARWTPSLPKTTFLNRGFCFQVGLVVWRGCTAVKAPRLGAGGPNRQACAGTQVGRRGTKLVGGKAPHYWQATPITPGSSESFPNPPPLPPAVPRLAPLQPRVPGADQGVAPERPGALLLPPACLLQV